MILWGFFEIAGMDAYVRLAKYQWAVYGTRLDAPLMRWHPGCSRPGKSQFYTKDEIRRAVAIVNKELLKHPSRW